MGTDSRKDSMNLVQRHKFEYTLYCPDCGSDMVLARAWININTYEYSESIDDRDYFCTECDEMKCEVVTLRMLWERFIKTPVKDGKITGRFICFEPGSPISEVMEWFDERCPNGAKIDLLNT